MGVRQFQHNNKPRRLDRRHRGNSVTEGVECDDTPRDHVRRQQMDFSNLESLRPVTPALYRPTHQSKPKNRALSTHRVIQDIRVMVEISDRDVSCCQSVSETGLGVEVEYYD